MNTTGEFLWQRRSEEHYTFSNGKGGGVRKSGGKDSASYCRLRLFSQTRAALGSQQVREPTLPGQLWAQQSSVTVQWNLDIHFQSWLKLKTQVRGSWKAQNGWTVEKERWKDNCLYKQCTHTHLRTASRKGRACGHVSVNARVTKGDHKPDRWRPDSQIHQRWQPWLLAAPPSLPENTVMNT